MALIAIFSYAGQSHAYTVKVVNCSDHNIIVTVAAFYLVTARDHLTIPVDPHSISTGSMGSLLSAGYRVAVDRGCPTLYNSYDFTYNGYPGSFEILVVNSAYDSCVLVDDSRINHNFSEQCYRGYIK